MSFLESLLNRPLLGDKIIPVDLDNMLVFLLVLLGEGGDVGDLLELPRKPTCVP